MRDGMPIGIGYLSISFAFGIMAASHGVPVLEACLISLFNLTSAGQLAALPIIAAAGSLTELALTQLMINLRYSLMSITLAQRFDKDIRIRDRFYLAFSLTDEMFAVAIGREARLGKKYLLSLMLMPYLGWVLGTLLGAIAGNVLPAIVTDALSVAMYAMFIAILVPAAADSRPVALCILISIALSCLFRYLPPLSAVPGGFTVIICALIASIILAIAAPVAAAEDADSEREVA